MYHLFLKMRFFWYIKRWREYQCMWKKRKRWLLWKFEIWWPTAFPDLSAYPSKKNIQRVNTNAKAAESSKIYIFIERKWKEVASGFEFHPKIFIVINNNPVYDFRVLLFRLFKTWWLKCHLYAKTILKGHISENQTNILMWLPLCAQFFFLFRCTST